MPLTEIPHGRRHRYPLSLRGAALALVDLLSDLHGRVSPPQILHLMHDQPVRWRKELWGLRFPRVLVDPVGGEFEAGLVINGERRLRLFLHEERVGQLPRDCDINPYGDDVIAGSDVQRWREELRALLAQDDGQRAWISDYLRALIALCEECLTNEAAEGLYYVGP